MEKLRFSSQLKQGFLSHFPIYLLVRFHLELPKPTFAMASYFFPFILFQLSSLVAQMVKRLPTMWETQVWSLGWEDTLEKEMATHSGTFAWRIPWMEERCRLQSMGSQRVGHDWATLLSLFTFQVLEKEMATHSSVLAWRIPGMGEPGGCRLWGRTESDMTEAT